MRKIFLLSIIALLIISCKKDNTVKDNLSGNWEYRGRACYCTLPVGLYGDKPGNGNIINFSGNSYKLYANKTLQQSGTYSITVITSGAETRNRMKFSNDSTYFPQYIKIEGAKMTFYGDVPAAADGVELYYEKIK